MLMTPETFVSLPTLLTSEQISVLICGGIHPRFQEAIQGQNVQLVWGVVGEWQDVLQAYLNGTLQTNPSFCLHHNFRRGYRFRKGQQGR
jgi:predicted Fe-Mo cluster-binding NifX family protein